MSCNPEIACNIFEILLQNSRIAVELPELSIEGIEYMLNAPVILEATYNGPCF